MEPVRAYPPPTPGTLVPPEPAQRHPAPLATELGRCDVTQAAGKICQGSAKSTAVSHLCSSMTSQTSGDTPPPTFPGPALRILPEARGESVRSRTIGCADPERLSGPRVRESARQPRSGISRLRMLSRLVGFQSTKGCWILAPPTLPRPAHRLHHCASSARRRRRHSSPAPQALEFAVRRRYWAVAPGLCTAFGCNEHRVSLAQRTHPTIGLYEH